MPSGGTDDFPGLPVGAARRLADERGWRVVRVLAPGAMMTMDHREGRLNLLVRDGVVERGWEG
ncbi:I78 family peptidase inhibitor [Kitasatospora sp. NBC_00315]|uniref:I78 family peptidase inhibitor n=1 Tax=Kitasatospora sp. NBC_00315 TaxID=2975963 RepID=UPI003243E03F